jgi:hypothetical protein
MSDSEAVADETTRLIPDNLRANAWRRHTVSLCHRAWFGHYVPERNVIGIRDHISPDVSLVQYDSHHDIRFISDGRNLAP